MKIKWKWKKLTEDDWRRQWEDIDINDVNSKVRTIDDGTKKMKTIDDGNNKMK